MFLRMRIGDVTANMGKPAVAEKRDSDNEIIRAAVARALPVGAVSDPIHTDGRFVSSVLGIKATDVCGSVWRRSEAWSHSGYEAIAAARTAYIGNDEATKKERAAHFAAMEKATHQAVAEGRNDDDIQHVVLGKLTNQFPDMAANLYQFARDTGNFQTLIDAFKLARSSKDLQNATLLQVGVFAGKTIPAGSAMLTASPIPGEGREAVVVHTSVADLRRAKGLLGKRTPSQAQKEDFVRAVLSSMHTFETHLLKRRAAGENLTEADRTFDTSVMGAGVFGWDDALAAKLTTLGVLKYQATYPGTIIAGVQVDQYIRSDKHQAADEAGAVVKLNGIREGLGLAQTDQDFAAATAVDGNLAASNFTLTADGVGVSINAAERVGTLVGELGLDPARLIPDGSRYHQTSLDAAATNLTSAIAAYGSNSNFSIRKHWRKYATPLATVLANGDINANFVGIEGGPQNVEELIAATRARKGGGDKAMNSTMFRLASMVKDQLQARADLIHAPE